MKILKMLLVLLILNCFLFSSSPKEFELTEKTKNIGNLSVIRYFDIPQNRYNTQLKLELLRNAPDYKKNLETLTNLRKSMFLEEYYIKIPSDKIYNYNVNHKAFIFVLNNYDNKFYTAAPFYNFNNIYSDYMIIFNNMPVFKMILDMGYYREETGVPIKIPMNEALVIENNKEDYNVFIYFKIKSWYDKNIKTSYTEIVLKNIKTGEIVYKQKYY